MQSVKIIQSMWRHYQSYQRSIMWIPTSSVKEMYYRIHSDVRVEMLWTFTILLTREHLALTQSMITNAHEKIFVLILTSLRVHRSLACLGRDYHEKVPSA